MTTQEIRNLIEQASLDEATRAMEEKGIDVSLEISVINRTRLDFKKKIIDFDDYNRILDDKTRSIITKLHQYEQSQV